MVIQMQLEEERREAQEDSYHTDRSMDRKHMVHRENIGMARRQRQEQGESIRLMLLLVFKKTQDKVQLRIGYSVQFGGL